MSILISFMNCMKRPSKKRKQKPKTSSMIPASMNIVNTIVGGGILEMPFIMMNFGVVLSLCIFVFVYSLTLLSLKLLLKAKQLLKLDDYYKMSLKTFHSAGGWVMKLSLLLNNLGMCVAYLIIFLNAM